MMSQLQNIKTLSDYENGLITDLLGRIIFLNLGDESISKITSIEPQRI